MEDEKCKNCIMNDNNKIQLIEFMSKQLATKPNAIQIISLIISCFTFGFVIARSIFK